MKILKGDEIKQARNRKGMTLHDVAKKAGCGAQTVWDLERGNREWSRHEVAITKVLMKRGAK